MTSVENPLVSIITVNYNGLEVTSAFLKSLKSLTYPNFEVIIVDNASSVNPTSDLLEIYPQAKVIMSKENLGFAGGNNLGIKNAKGDFLFFVNNDTELTANIIETLMETTQNLKNVGIVCPKFHYFFHPGIIEYAGYHKMNFLTARNKMVGNKEKDLGQHNEPKETNYAHGGAMLVARQVINKVGPLPECYFLYYEEFDWCEQIKRKGLKIYYQPNALIYHKESMTTGKESLLKTYYLTRNRLLFMRRNATTSQFFIFLIFFTLFTIPKNILSFLVRGKINHLKAFTKGISWHLTANKNLVYN
ncbi:MAG: glycosyltransferase family 2 protein [Cyclobacteriaceae bacterium]|nr:glycosyltransferase family 2 protein [Cyclobacteriaceae bacterium]